MWSSDTVKISQQRKKNKAWAANESECSPDVMVGLMKEEKLFLDEGARGEGGGGGMGEMEVMRVQGSK